MAGQKSLKEFFKPLTVAKGVKRPFAETESNNRDNLVSRSTHSSPSDSLSENHEAVKVITCKKILFHYLRYIGFFFKDEKSSSSLPLTPDAKKRMLSNQLSAKIKLQHRKTCALHHSIGENWFKAIEPEFQKPYFVKV